MYNTKEGKSCVIYIRVSSERQVKGYSLDGQKHYLAECAERRGMTVLDTYVEEGKSGKSIEGRTEFQRMLDDIQSGKVHTDYVLVFKLSRFGRNARDVLNSLEFIMKYGVHLMCVEDGLDSSTSMGKMMITILGAVAELERENIIAQSLLGREEKAKSGGWNGGFAPYGYRLVKGDDKSKGKLETVPEEKAVVQLVFDMFLNRNMGYTAISGYLNRNGYTRPPAKNAIRPSYGEWSSDHIKRMLSNPVYTGRVAWGKRRTEKVPGKDNEYRLVKQDEYILSEVISHEAFVSKEDFDRVQEIKAIRGKKGNHNIGQYNAHLLSGIVKCPQCGAPMYIGMTKWTNQDGTERRTESYVCSYATKHRGTSVCRRNGVVASQVEDEVMEYTRKIVRNPQFIKDLQEKVMTAVDMTEVENDITAYKNQLSALQRSRDSLERDIDRIAPDDKYAERRRADMTRRLNDLYDQIYKAEDLLQESMMKKATLESNQMSVQSMIGILSSFDAIYDRMNAAERRDLVKYLISEVIPPRLYKEAVHLNSLRDKIMELLSGTNPLTARSRAAEVERLLDEYIPGVEKMKTRLKKYGSEYKALKEENAELESRLRTAEDAGKERIANRLKYAGMEKELQELHSMLDNIPPEILTAFRQRSERQKEASIE